MEPTPGLPGRRRQLALAAVILSSAALTLVWVFLVPIYQAPDEPMNLDYALAINAHGGLFHLSAASFETLPTYVHPHTEYLDRECRTAAVAFHPTVKMPPEYGTWAYFAALDRAGPARREVQGPNKPFAVYPYGYYGLVALWVGCLHIIHDGPVFVFFGARILSVLLLVMTLIIIDATVRRLHFKPWTALMLTAIIAFFPLTTSVASAVQTDNLSFTLISAVFYLALRVKERPTEYRWHTLLGLTFGWLLVTKIHFFLCVAVPVLAFLWTEIVHVGLTWRERIAAGLLWGGPGLVTGGVYLWTTWGTTNLYGAASNHHGLSHAIHWIRAAVLDYYGGLSHDSFWGTFGWLDAPLMIHNHRTTAIISSAIQAAAWIFLALTLVRFEQVTSRIARAACNGRTWWAWRMLVSNPLINSYFVFTGVMLILYVRVENRFGAQGRNWLPLLLPFVLTNVRYTPKALTLKPVQVALARTVTVGLLLYCLVGSIYAIPTLKNRYYGVPMHHDTIGNRGTIKPQCGIQVSGKEKRILQSTDSVG